MEKPSVEAILSVRVRRLPVRLTAHGARHPTNGGARRPGLRYGWAQGYTRALDQRSREQACMDAGF